MQKWTNTNAGPIQCKRFNDAWNKLSWENNTYVELTGVIGQSERSSVLTALSIGGGGDTRADVTAAKERIGERFGWTISAQTVNDAIRMMGEELATLQKNRPVKDKRVTPEAHSEREANLQRIYTEQKARGDEQARAFVARYGNGETVTVQPGQMAVIAKICFDNSDLMSDYFDSHASLSQPFALLVVPKQAETERLARRGVAVSSLLSALTFKWHTEKWSMGHGNYLETESGFELPTELQNLRTVYNGGPVTHAHWEISFRAAYGEPVTLDAIAGYGQTPTAAPMPAAVSDVTVSENAGKDGIEIRFPSKPAADVLESLKAHGWRWSRFSQCWYTRRSDEARQFAASLTGSSNQATKTEPQDAPAPVARRHDIPDEVLDVLRRAHIDGDSVKLNGQLDRDLYLKVNKTLEAVGGKWNRGRQCHVFAQNPRDVLGLDEGRINPDGMNAAAIEKAIENGIQAKAIPNLFPTPPDLAARMVTLADLQPGHRVLEPSAGTGNILRAIGPQPDKVAVEINSSLVEILTRSPGSGTHIIEGDFLEQNGNLGMFDAILMNPPFENGADIKHIKHALTFLKLGGRLVAICANGPQQQEQLRPLAATWEELPADTFKAQGTSVRAVLLTVETPA